MDFEEIRRYWEDRAAGDSTSQSTTQDVYLREIEYGVLAERLPRYSTRSVADVGCGDGRTMVRLAEKFPEIGFSGFDYSDAMVSNARSVLAQAGLRNARIDRADICEGMEHTFDAVYTTRCLINVPSWA